LEKCLRSIFEQTKNIEFEVFVVDNDSRDGTVEMVKQRFPQVNLIANQENAGFAKANNQAIKLAKGRYVLLLNPDTEILENALEKMVEFVMVVETEFDIEISDNKVENMKTFGNLVKYVEKELSDRTA